MMHRRRNAQSLLLLYMLIIVITIALFVRQFENMELKEQLKEQDTMPIGLTVLEMDKNGFVELKVSEPIRFTEQEKKSLKTHVASRNAVRPIMAHVTAYTWTGNKTASGTWPEQGRTCAGPRDIPFGTVVYIPGVGERTVEDRTARKYDGRYDVYMDSEDACFEWGIQRLEVKILN